MSKNFRNIMLIVPIFIVLTAVGVVFINHCAQASKIRDYKTSRYSLTAVEVLNNHFAFRDKKDIELFRLTLAPEFDTIRFDNENFNEVVKIEKADNDEVTKDYTDGIKAVKVESFNVCFKSNSNDSTYTLRYILCKEQEDSPWLIYAWGFDG